MVVVDFITWERHPVNLASPVLIAAFKGWNDAGEAASFATGYLRSVFNADRIATVDPETFFDFQSHRPRISIEDGVLNRPIEWPTLDVFAAHAGPERDLIIIHGIEPSMRWPTLTNGLLGVARELGVTQVVTLGAFLADVPHTRPVRVSGMSHPADFIAELGVRRPDYTGPTGMVGTFHAAAIEHGFPAASLWAAVPHYVGAAPSPNASLALLSSLGSTLRLPIDFTELEQTIHQFEEQVNEAVASNPQASALVAQLEQSFDREEELPFGPLPTGDAIAADFERYLREHASGDIDPS